MLARTESALSIRSPLEYNEQKVAHNEALLLDAHNFLQEKEELTMQEKRDRFQELAVRNERSQKKIIHLSVNFPVADKLEDRQMVRIAAEFMQGIGFRDQPWLLYRHIDAGHPHMHIVSTNIRPDGSRISSDLRSPHHLMQVCFGIEEKYGLTPALTMPDLFGLDQSREVHGETRYLKSLVYGEMPTKTAIAAVLRVVNNRFVFDSFEAYNAVLSLYNVRADRGREDGVMYRNRGLYYRMTDAQGRKVGAPIKASDFDLGVTLDKVGERCRLNQEQVQQAKRRIAIYVGCHLTGEKSLYSLQVFREDIRRDKIQVIIPALTERGTRRPQPTPSPQSDNGHGLHPVRSSSPDDGHRLQPIQPPPPDDGHGFFYLDITNLTVVRDTDLGQKYTAAAILQQTGVERELRELHEQRQLQVRRPADEIALRQGHPDTAGTRRALLRLTDQHNEIVKQKQAQEDQRILAMRQRRGHRL